MSQYLFNSVPTIHRKRNVFDLSHRLFTSLNVGELAPVYLQEVYPGDDFKVDSAFISRVTSSLLRPVMDNVYLDQMFFFVPSRLLYDKFKNVMGESEGAWAPSKTYKVPEIYDACVKASESQAFIASGTVGDYLGLPSETIFGQSRTQEDFPVISLLPFRAFALIYNDWFRDENVEQPMLVQRGEAVASERPNQNDWSPSNYVGKLPKVNKLHDYFTSALPSPQKGENVALPLSGTAPIVPVPGSASSRLDTLVDMGVGSVRTQGRRQLSSYRSVNGADDFDIQEAGDDGNFGSVQFKGYSTLTGSALNGLLEADLSDSTAANINDLRTATQLQRMLERDARGGTRYIEYIRSAFGVDSGDYRLQRPEFLGGRRTPLQVQQVPQTVGAGKVVDGESLGSLGAYSLSFGTSGMRKGFLEHGYIIGVACLRQKHTYQQGINKMWSRVERTDFYDPVFQNLGEQPIYETEIYNGGFSSGAPKKKDIFGYQEAWADLRQCQNRVSGSMRSSSGSGLDIWHYASNYGAPPVLNSAFLRETENNVNRSLAVPHTDKSNPQFILEFDFKVRATRVLPKYSVPGLLDHN